MPGVRLVIVIEYEEHNSFEMSLPTCRAPYEAYQLRNQNPSLGRLNGGLSYYFKYLFDFNVLYYYYYYYYFYCFILIYNSKVLFIIIIIHL